MGHNDFSAVGFLFSDRLLVRKENKVRAYLNRCPHTDGPLDWNPDQFLDEHSEFIMCANHAALFEIENGLCVAGPCVNQRLRPVNTCIEDGVVYFVDQRSE